MKAKSLIGLIALLFVLSPVVSAQSRDTGAIVGKVADEEGNALPGVNVTLTSPNLMGVRTSVSDANGEFRFPALPPGEYTLKAELSGFGPASREGIRVTTTSTLNIDMTMRPSAMAEEITIIAEAPTVDVKSTETASVTLSNEILRNVPYSQFTADIVNLAPGVNDNVAYGASQNTGVAYSMDGVNVADPEAGSAWVFSDHNAIEEAKVMGVGLPAEYGNFTGVIFNLVTKSGGNELSGHFEFNFQGYKDDSSFWQATNNGAYTNDFPGLTSPSSKLMDVNGHLGGPIIKDKLWFYVGGQFYRTQNRPSGFPEDVDYKQPRFFAKLSSQLDPTLSMTGVFQTTAYQGTNRGASSTRSPEACVTQDSPDWLASFSLTKILSPNTFFDLKVNYFQGRYYLDPEVGFDPYTHRVRFVDPGFEEFANGRKRNWRYDSAGYFYWADRNRFGANASLTHYTEDFIAGSHDFKFGVEVERSGARSQYGYSGRGGELGDNVKYVDAFGYGPYGYVYSGSYLAYQYEGYDTNTQYTRLEAFAQDSWQVSERLNLSLGVRVGQNWGQVKDKDGNVFKSGHVDPRLGFTFDILGDKTTILKAHFGHFTEAMLTAYHDKMNPLGNFKDYVGYYFVPDDNDPATNGGQWYEWFRIPPTAYEMDSGIKHPYMVQFTVGIERELFKDTSFGVTYINRKWNNLIGRYDRAAVYDVVDYYSPELNKTFQIYNRTEDSLETTDFIITNLNKSGDYPNILLDPYRKYEGLEFLFNKRFSNRWQLLVSYVYSKASGTRDNGFGGDIGWGEDPSDPNSYVNAEGNLTFDNTHMFKLQGTYILPLDISLSAYFRAITGPSWTTQVGAPLNQGYVYFFAEPRGSNHYPMEKTLDIRLEKIFTLAGKYRLGVIFDVFNVLNDDTITAWGTIPGEDWFEGESPSTDGHDLYGIALPRQARVGIRVIF